MASLDLYLSALTNALVSVAWGILAVQRWRQGTNRVVPPREMLDAASGGEGS
jgi:hypothetical protein